MIHINQYDVAGILKTYSEKCINARNTEQLKEFVRELKKLLNYEEIRRMKVD